MTCTKFNTIAELRKLLQNRPMRVDPVLLLGMIAEDYLALKGHAAPNRRALVRLPGCSSCEARE